MLNSKQRAYLKSIASNIDPAFQVGKGGVNDAMILQISDYLRAHEIIKIKCLENSLYNASEAANEIAGRIGAEVVTTIGSKAVLYKRNNENPKIELKP